MWISSSFNTEMVDDARQMSSRGHSPNAVVTQLRARWNMSRERAEKLYRRVTGDRDTERVEIVRSPDAEVTRWTADSERSDTAGTSVPWPRLNLSAVATVIGIAVIALIAFGIFSIATSGFWDPPAESAVAWEHVETERVGASTVRLTGSIENTDDDWTLREPVLVTEFYSETGVVVASRRSELDNVGDIGPRQTGYYSFQITLFEEFATSESTLEWEWER